ncbi:hypothetical protein HDV00_009128 [Rhizophlyctis rosea]|nr:hypothetical protein HDV00_009128 [Rhizophlyctis rosea]
MAWSKRQRIPYSASKQYRHFHASLPSCKTVPFLLADIGEGITECEIVKWFVKPGDRVEQFTPVCEVQSDKAAVEITSRYDGIIKHIHYKPGDVARVGAPLLDIETDAPAANDSVPTPAPFTVADEPATQPTSQSETGKRTLVPPSAASPLRSEELSLQNIAKNATLATPAVRRVARENNIDLSAVRGSGPDGRVLKGDVLAFVAGFKPGQPTPKPALDTTSPPQPIPSDTKPSPQLTERKPLTTIQKAMYKSMTKSLSIPHFSFSDEITINATSSIRQQINGYLKKHSKAREFHGVDKISYMPIFIKALSVALEEFPLLNSRVALDESGNPALEYRGAHNVGVAMDTPQGLLVPNIKSVNTKSILTIAQDLHTLRHLATKSSLQTSHLRDGTITLSNIGVVGGTVMHPVLVETEVCIGAIGAVRRLPRFEVGSDGVERVVAKEVMGVSFSADHRVVDGATVARFVGRWKELLEEPGWLLASLK